MQTLLSTQFEQNSPITKTFKLEIRQYRTEVEYYDAEVNVLDSDKNQVYNDDGTPKTKVVRRSRKIMGDDDNFIETLVNKRYTTIRVNPVGLDHTEDFAEECVNLMYDKLSEFLQAQFKLNERGVKVPNQLAKSLRTEIEIINSEISEHYEIENGVMTSFTPTQLKKYFTEYEPELSREALRLGFFGL